MNEAWPAIMETTFVEEAGGVYKMRLINGPIAAALNVAARKGDREAHGVLHVLAAYFDELAVTPEQSTCLACDAAVSSNNIPLIAMLEPAISSCSVVVLNCICVRCVAACADSDRLMRTVLKGYGRRMMKNPRVINVSSEIGHA